MSGGNPRKKNQLMMILSLETFYFKISFSLQYILNWKFVGFREINNDSLTFLHCSAKESPWKIFWFFSWQIFMKRAHFIITLFVP